MKTNEQLQAENKAIRDMLAAGAEAELRAIPGVVHVSVGLKQQGATLTDTLCIRVYVQEKKQQAAIPATEVIPPEINGIPTDVNVVGRFDFSIDNTRYRPIKGGIQVTNRIVDVNAAGNGTQMSRGTLGCVAIDKTDDAPVLLSNWHVLYANSGHDGELVFQPAPTSLPRLTLLQLPFRPTDDTDKIGVLRRSKISDKVDGAIAAIDVSSWCNCCGIRYSNEIHGLSKNGQPPRNTIVGDEKAVSGMKVFKVGQSTGRSEGVVVDDDYPSFSIEKGGNTYSFTGQIAIQHVTAGEAFSDHGDSGSVIINLNNKIVGLLFASGKNVPVNGVDQPFVSLANHIGDVFAALNIRIAYSPDIVTNAGDTLLEVPPDTQEAPIPEPYRALRERFQQQPGTAALFALAERHSQEIIDLVNRRRPVLVTWRRAHGPALLAALMIAVRDGHHRLPAAVQGVSLHEALERMRLVLAQHGSPELQALMRSEVAAIVADVLKASTRVDELISRLAADPHLNALLEGDQL